MSIVIPDEAIFTEWIATADAIFRDELRRPPALHLDPAGLASMLQIAAAGGTAETMIAAVRSSPEWIALHAAPVVPPVPLDQPFHGAFCIPDALPGIPFGDGRRIWTPAFACYRGLGDWQDRMIAVLQARRYTWLEYQLSGRPYGSDYPEIPLDVAAIVADLTKIRQAGLGTIIAFRDDVGTDCAYLQPVADATQDLVDCVMGIYESNGVFAEPDGSYSAATYAKVEDVLRQQRALWPRAINAFHSTSQMNGQRGFGERDFWARLMPIVDVYFLQQTAWTSTLADTANRAQDFTERLMGGKSGWPVLRQGVVLFEETTSRTYRDWTEAQGVAMMDALLGLITPRPVGFMDGGTPT